MKIKSYIEQLKQDRADNSAFRKKAALARREAYRKEALKVAENRGRAIARRKGFSEVLFPSMYPRAKAKPTSRRRTSRRVIYVQATRRRR